MIKILILVAIVALTTTLGVFLSANKKKRMQIFCELYEFNEKLLLNLKFERKPVEKVAEGFKFVPQILRGEKLIEGQEGEEINDYLVNLGKTDASSQIDYLNGRKAMLETLKNASCEDYKKYGSLYVKIFFMIGVLAAILLA